MKKIDEKHYEHKGHDIELGENFIKISKGELDYTLYTEENPDMNMYEVEVVGFIETKFEEFAKRLKEKQKEKLSDNSKEISFPQCKNCTFRDEDFSKMYCQIYDIKPNEYDYDTNEKCPFFLEEKYDKDTDIRIV